MKGRICFFILASLLFSCCANGPTQQTELGPNTGVNDLRISSTAFGNNKKIPDVYTCNDQGISPPLTFENVPENAKSLALILDDPDAPSGTFTHWLIWNIPANLTGIDENSVPDGGVQGKNSDGETGYTPPCPPYGTHRYYFKLYALDTMLKLPPGSDKKALSEAMKGHIIAQTEYVGLYSK